MSLHESVIGRVRNIEICNDAEFLGWFIETFKDDHNDWISERRQAARQRLYEMGIINDSI